MDNNYDDFKKELENGKFVFAHRDGTPETEEIIKQETKATIRCIPQIPDMFSINDAKDWCDQEFAKDISKPGTCIKTGKPSTQRVLFAIAY